MELLLLEQKSKRNNIKLLERYKYKNLAKENHFKCSIGYSDIYTGVDLKTLARKFGRMLDVLH